MRGVVMFLFATAIIICFSYISGCGGAGSASVKGRVFKGPVGKSTVTVYRLEANGLRGERLDSYSTDDRGYFQMGASYDFPVLLAAKGGSFVWEATGEIIDMGDSFELLAMFPSIKTGQYAAVTAFTHMATFQVPVRLEMGEYLQQAIVNSNNDIAVRFGIPEVDLLHVLPMDLTDEEESADTGALEPTPVDQNLNIKINNECSPSCLYGLAHAALSIGIEELVNGDESQWAEDPNYKSSAVVMSVVAVSNKLGSIGSAVARSVRSGTVATYLIGTNISLAAFLRGMPGWAQYFLGGGINGSGIGPGGVVISPPPGKGGTLPPSPTPPPGATMPPSLPPGITSVGTCGDTATLAWTTVTNATDYVVHFGTTPDIKPGGGVSVGTSIPTLTIRGLQAGVTYYFVVTAANSAGESFPSKMVSVTPSIAAAVDGFQQCLQNTINYFSLYAPGALKALYIDCPNMNISSISGIENLGTYMIHSWAMVHIDLSGNSITDFRPLGPLLNPPGLCPYCPSPLTLVQTLNLGGNGITDVGTITSILSGSPPAVVSGTPGSTYTIPYVGVFQAPRLNLNNNHIQTGFGTMLGRVVGPGSVRYKGNYLAGTTTPSIPCTDLAGYVGSSFIIPSNPVAGVDCR